MATEQGTPVGRRIVLGMLGLGAAGVLGGPVTREHGGPVRLYVAPMYGYKSLKWLDGIEVTNRVIPGYWEQNGYDVDAWIGRSNGRDDAPV